MSASLRTDVSGLRHRWDEDLAAHYRRQGWWDGLTLADRARALAEADPQRVTHVDGQTQLTAGQAWQQSGWLAAALAARGFGPGDVLAFQTPNWHEAVLIDLAACRLGLVVCPIVTIYRDREVELILDDCRARGIFVAQQFRGFDHQAMLQRLRPRLPRLQQLWTVRGDVGAADDLSTLLAEGREAFAGWSAPRVDPDALKLLLYTSGTTGRPKAVLHSHNTLARSMRRAAAHWGLVAGDTTLMPSPVTHVTGFTYGLELPFCERVRTVLMAQWDAAQAAALIEREAIAFTLCATPFLQELLDLCERERRSLPSLRSFPCGGAAVPPELIRRVSRVFAHCRAFRVYGSSEAPVITLGYPQADQAELAATTDGQVIDYEVRLLGADGRPCAVGEEGEICARGPGLFLGYAAEADNAECFDDDGFFHTGDVGQRTAEGAIVFTGRIKDLINRGGEKISAKEVEDLLHTHPGVLEAAVVAMPHARLGETVCAYLITEPGVEVTLPALVATLQAAQVARQKHPEAVVLVEQFPRTASGKVKKDLLRADLRARGLGV
ncbi:MAG: AMP-binding protein [Burkholderiaceae bacterium]|nr:AMP-binding protein [Burkholderiaceae bacterium]